MTGLGYQIQATDPDQLPFPRGERMAATIIVANGTDLLLDDGVGRGRASPAASLLQRFGADPGGVPSVVYEDDPVEENHADSPRKEGKNEYAALSWVDEQAPAGGQRFQAAARPRGFSSEQPIDQYNIKGKGNGVRGPLVKRYSADARNLGPRSTRTASRAPSTVPGSRASGVFGQRGSTAGQRAAPARSVLVGSPPRRAQVAKHKTHMSVDQYWSSLFGEDSGAQGH